MFKTIVIDCGHGGLLNGKYTTGLKKMFKFPNGEVAYEGVINRMFGKMIGDMLIEKGYNVVYTVEPSDPTDTPLWKRVAISNKYRKDEALFLSIHCNAFNSRAHGSEIFTTVGKTMSDLLADDIMREINKSCKELKMRWDLSDGDLDKESQFYVIRKTRLYAVLLECLFFDNWENYQLTKDEDFVCIFSSAVARGVDKFVKSM